MSEVTLMEEPQGIANCCECEATEKRMNGWIKKASAAPEQEAVGVLLINDYFDSNQVGDVDVQLDSKVCERLAAEYPGQSLPFYLRAKTPEVERLRAELEAESKGADRAAEAMLHWKKEADSLRQQLAETQALLREALTHRTYYERHAMYDRINAFLSATAQPAEVKS